MEFCQDCGEPLDDSGACEECTYLDRPVCPECGSRDSRDSEEDYHNEQYRYCNACGTVYNPANDEIVEDYTANVYLHLDGMTKSEAESYVYEMLDHIQSATGYKLYFDKLDE